VGILFVATELEIGKKVLSLYLTAVPTYSLVYGAFAALPILLVNPDTTLLTPLTPLTQQLLFDRALAVDNLWEKASWLILRLCDAL